jgi:hypothetical protein
MTTALHITIGFIACALMLRLIVGAFFRWNKTP